MSISGTFPAGAAKSCLTVAMAVFYIFFYFAFVVLAPILVTGAAILAVFKLIFLWKWG